MSLQIELLNGRALRRGEVLVFRTEGEVAKGRENALLLFHFRGGRADQLDLLFEWDAEWVALVWRLPAQAISFDGGELDRSRLERGIGARDTYCLASDPCDFILVDKRRGGKAPRAAGYHAHAETE